MIYKQSESDHLYNWVIICIQLLLKLNNESFNVGVSAIFMSEVRGYRKVR